MLEEVAASGGFYALNGGKGGGFDNALYEELLGTAAASTDLAANAGLINEVNAGNAAATNAVAMATRMRAHKRLCFTHDSRKIHASPESDGRSIH